MTETIGNKSLSNLKDAVTRFKQAHPVWQFLRVMLFDPRLNKELERGLSADIQNLLDLRSTQHLPLDQSLSTPSSGLVFASEISPPEETHSKKFTPFRQLLDSHTHSFVYDQWYKAGLIDGLNPILMFLHDEIRTIEQSKANAHSVRSTTVTDCIVADSPPRNTRLPLRYAVMYAHAHEMHQADSYFDEVKQALYQGSDLDLVMEFENMDDFIKRFTNKIGGYYEEYHRRRNQRGGTYLGDNTKNSYPFIFEAHPIKIMELKTDNEEIYLWSFDKTQIFTPTRWQERNQTRFGKPFWHDAYLRLTKKKARSGISIIEIDLCSPADEGIKITPEVARQLDVHFGIAISQYDVLPKEVQRLDARSGTKANSWDRNGRGKLVLQDEFGIEIPDDSFSVLTSPIQAGETILNHTEDMSNAETLAYFSEALREFRKSIVQERMLELSRQGRKYIHPASSGSYYWGKFGYPIAITDEALRSFDETLHNSSFREKFARAWVQLSPEKRRHNSIRYAADLLTMVFYNAKKTWRILDDFAIRDYFPHMQAVPKEVWQQIYTQLPDPARQLLSAQLRAGPPFENIANILKTNGGVNLAGMMGRDLIPEVILQNQSMFHIMAQILSENGINFAHLGTYDKIDLNGLTAMSSFFCIDPEML